MTGCGCYIKLQYKILSVSGIVSIAGDISLVLVEKRRPLFLCTPPSAHCQWGKSRSIVWIHIHAGPPQAATWVSWAKDEMRVITCSHLMTVTQYVHGILCLNTP